MCLYYHIYIWRTLKCDGDANTLLFDKIKCVIFENSKKGEPNDPNLDFFASLALCRAWHVYHRTLT